MLLTDLAPAITGVLTAPGVDLSLISAKSVRKSLLAADAGLDPDWVRSNKQGIDELIARIFNEISASQQVEAPNSGSNQVIKRKREQTEDSSFIPHPPATATASRSRTSSDLTKKERTPVLTKQEIEDAEYARRVNEELNAHTGRGRTTRGGTLNTPSNGHSSQSGTHASKKRKTGRSNKVKSPSKIVDSDGSDASDDDDDDASDVPAKKSVAKKRRSTAKSGGGEGGVKGGFQKEYLLSEPLSAICDGATRLSRPQVVKALWKYIKEKGLQDPRNKRDILCDDKFREMFRSNRINMFSMNKDLGSHLYDPEDA